MLPINGSLDTLCSSVVQRLHALALLIWLEMVPQLQLSVDVEVVFSRGTLMPEQQKKVPFTRTQEEAQKVDGDDGVHRFAITVGSIR